jgi:hypothetical protein
VTRDSNSRDFGPDREDGDEGPDETGIVPDQDGDSDLLYLADPGEVPDLSPYFADPDQESLRHMDAFADVIGFAKRLRYSFALGDDAFVLVRNEERLFFVSTDSWVDNPLQAARSLLVFILDDLP